MSDQSRSRGRHKITESPSNTSEEPGLEDIRSSWQKLDESSSPPKNLQDWQMRQRALKEQERRNKTASAAMLHNYRGDVKESDFKKMREKDREGKLNAEKWLHSYRAPVGSVQAAKRKGGAPLVQADATTGSSWASEGADVSLLAEKFNFSAETEEVISEAPVAMGRAKDGMVQKQELPTGSQTTVSPDNADELVGSTTNDAIVDRKAPVDSSVTEKTESPTERELGSSGELVKEPDLVAEPSLVHNGDDWVTVSPPEENPSVAAANPNEGVAGSSTDRIADATMTQIEKPLGAQQIGPRRVDVDFSFGLLSNSMDPHLSVSKYMKAAEIVIRDSLSSSLSSITYNSSCPPIVKNVVTDASYVASGGRSNVMRFVVYAVVPVFLSDESNNVHSARHPVRGALRSAIKDGSFLTIAIGEDSAPL